MEAKNKAKPLLTPLSLSLSVCLSGFTTTKISSVQPEPQREISGMALHTLKDRNDGERSGPRDGEGGRHVRFRFIISPPIGEKRALQAATATEA